MLPRSSAAWASGARRVARAWRRATQLLRRLSRAATAVPVRPSSCRSESTTRASSMAVRVRGGALARRRSALAWAGSQAASTTTGTWASSRSNARAYLLKPSTISNEPSLWGTTLSGISARGSSGGRGRGAPRKLAKLVRSRDSGACVRPGEQAARSELEAPVTAGSCTRALGRAGCRSSARGRCGSQARRRAGPRVGWRHRSGVQGRRRGRGRPDAGG